MELLSDWIERDVEKLASDSREHAFIQDSFLLKLVSGLINRHILSRCKMLRESSYCNA